MNGKPSGRVLADDSGKEEHVTFDEKDEASIARAHGYDPAPGKLYNAIMELAPAERDLVLAQPQKDRERIMKLEGEKLSAAIAALAKPKPDKSKSVPAGGEPAGGAAKEGSAV